MDPIVDSLAAAYQDFVGAAAAVLESSSSSDSLESFKQHWELFKVACDQAEEFVESLKQRIGSECLVDEATGYLPAPASTSSSGPGTAAIPPISAVRLEQMSKAVRWLVIELQQGAGSGSGANPNPQEDPAAAP